MKRKLAFLLVIFATLFGSVAVCAQSKQAEKDGKKRAKELKKEGWKLQASTHTLEYVLIQYNTYLEADPENRFPLTGVAVGQNPKIGRENAINNAINSYASRAKAQVVGRIKSIMSSDASVTTEEIDKFGAAYESGVNTRLSNFVKQHFVLVRESNGNKEFNVFLSLDEAQVKKAREEAAAEAKKQASLGQLSEEVDQFIGEPVEEY